MIYKQLVSPVTRKALVQARDTLRTDDGTETYPVIKGVPVLLTGGIRADWHREIMEVLLWQFPEKLDELYAKLDWSAAIAPVYVEYITDLLKDKEGILSAVRQYASDDTDRWIIQSNDAQPITSEDISSFKWRNKRRHAHATVKSARREGQNHWAAHLPKYAALVHSGEPSIILELSTGSGFGTSAIADKKSSNSTMFTMDIGFSCHGNTISIAKYLRMRDTLLPVCANFWHMPFADESVDVVCSHFGLDESREIQRTIAEISRVLKIGGRFVNVSRSNASLRSFNLFEPFGFTREETVEVIKTARIYSDTESLIDECEGHGLTLREKYDFQASNEQTREVTVSTFIRERTT